MTTKIKLAETRADYAQCVQIRTVVFVIGQDVPFEREVDEYEDTSVHYIALYNGEPAGTVRWRFGGEGVAKIERFAVLETFQGQGIGKAIMDKLLSDLRVNPDVKKIKLSSQDHAIPFYERFGFSVAGEGYDDAGIPHHDMTLAA